jgi:CrcB protein
MKFDWLYVFIGGGLGSVCRYGLHVWLNAKNSLSIPWGTFASNFAACLLLGYAVSKFAKEGQSEGIWVFLISVGFCGGFSTFSTFSKENYELLVNGSYGILTAYVTLSLILGVVGFILGHSIA